MNTIYLVRLVKNGELTRHYPPGSYARATVGVYGRSFEIVNIEDASIFTSHEEAIRYFQEWNECGELYFEVERWKRE